MNLKEGVGLLQPPQAVPPETPEADPGRGRFPDRLLCPAGDHDLPSVGGRADPGGGVHRDTDVSDVGELGATTVNPDPDPDFQVPGPLAFGEAPLDRGRRLDRVRGGLEDGEEIVGPCIDRVAAGSRHRVPQDAPHVPQQVAIALLQPVEQGGGLLDVAHEKGQASGGQRGGVEADRRLPTLGLQLAGDEPHRYDPIPLRRVQQTLAGPLACRLALEGDLIEAGERVPQMRLVVDGKPPPAARVDVGEGAVRKPCARAGVELRHAKNDIHGPVR